ncbi:MAG: phenylacetate--CoA ligase [Alphaproteobacteria bacterium]|nr:phenylacetate--CoA ligase [Alphaproteobacteria bacterium]
MVLALPESRDEIQKIQSARKKVAVENAKRAPFFCGKLDHIDVDRLDDPDEWRKIPILDKDMLRAIPPEHFYRDFCIARQGEIAEFWRSGGQTGRPLFYPRTFEDIRYAMEGFARTYRIAGVGKGDVVHNSFPLGIHPAGHMWARSAFDDGIGVNWVGSGAAAPSAMQIQLLDAMKPTCWMGMSSYGIHLANLAAAAGIDLANGPVEKVLCTAEPMSAAKRDKLQRMWGADVYDCFGMTECSMMAGESADHDGLHVWTDFTVIEVLDADTLEPVAKGKPGLLIMTSLYTNNATPFLRWNAGDIVSFHEEGATEGPYGVFPMIRHAHRTAGFFKIRGMNVNHSEFEDFMFAIKEVGDFKAEACATDGVDLFRVTVEITRGADAEAMAIRLVEMTRETFELTPEVVVVEQGTLAKEFENSVKAPRFADRRSESG